MAALLIISVVGLFVFISSEPHLTYYLEHHGFRADLAPQIASFSSGQILWFIFFLSLTAGTIVAILSGGWSGSTAKWAGIYLGAILVFDLSRADTYWVHYVDYQEKLAPNSVVDFLGGSGPYEHRVAGRLRTIRARVAASWLALANSITSGFRMIFSTTTFNPLISRRCRASPILIAPTAETSS